MKASFSTESVDLTNCDREPIHVPEQIQSYGVMVAVDPATMRVVRVSANVEAMLGRPPERWIGARVRDCFPPAAARAIEQGVEDLSGAPRLVFTGDCGQGRRHDVLAHVYAGRLLLELDVHTTPGAQGAGLLEATNAVIHALGQPKEMDAFCGELARQVRALLGYHRVMIYRFAHDWHGWVAAEDRREDLEPFLGLHYPASDIPVPARRLFLLNRVRMIVDVDHEPTRMFPEPQADEVRLDMSLAILRGVSPIHIEYLHNMGVRATLTMAIRRRGELWGMIACHHYEEPRHLPPLARTSAELVVCAAEMRVAELLAREESSAREHRARNLQVITQSLAEHEELSEGLKACEDALLALVRAGGFVAWLDGSNALRMGETPPDGVVSHVVQMLYTHEGKGLVHAHHLASLVPEAERCAHVAAGLLAVPLTHAKDSWLLWFRPELRRSVHWAGSPDKPVEVGPLGSRLTPRKSFELWVQEVRDQSEHWSEIDLEAGESLRTALSDVLYRERARLLALNEELERRNEELDSFSSMASHDLRGPLRAIANYSKFLREDAGEALDPESRSHLDAIDRLVRRMYTLIEGLLVFARFGRTSLAYEVVDVGEVVREVIGEYESVIHQKGATVTVASELPALHTWRVGIHEIVANLVGNALKYSERAPVVEIGVAGPERYGDQATVPANATVIYVEDQGIGIDPRHHSSIFRMFQQLHPDGRYGAGSGIGLPVVRKLVERLGGTIWLRSERGEGTTFYFSLIDLREQIQ